MTTRRDFLSVAAASIMAGNTFAATDAKYRLIAHRGGLVDDQHAENSPSSAQDAIDHGYWMLEVDIRRTKDGEAILQHDADFQRYYGEPRAVDQMTWQEISRLRAQPGRSKPMRFQDLCAICKGKTRLMLDIKGETFPNEFYETLGKTLGDYGLLRTAYLLGGGPRSRAILGPECYRACDRRSLREAIERGEDVKARCYLFELASELDQEALTLCTKAGVTAVAAINTFRYTMAKRDEEKGPAEDAARLVKLGVSYYQIDSRYESLFAKA